MTSIQKRLAKEYSTFTKSPVPLSGAQPREDDIRTWDCAFQLEFKGSDGKVVSFPIAFVVEFPEEYPRKAPDVGFCVTFDYRDGASHIIDRPGTPLHGKFTVCIDLLGNYAKVHDEWASIKASGWSPAYNISTLIVVRNHKSYIALQKFRPDN